MSYSKRLHTYSSHGNQNDGYFGNENEPQSEIYNYPDDALKVEEDPLPANSETSEKSPVNPPKKSFFQRIRSKRNQNLCDAIVTTMLNLLSFCLLIIAIVAPSLLLILVNYNAWFFIIFSTLIIPCLIATFTSYYSCISWIRGAVICRCCLVLNGFIAFGIVSATISLMIAIGGTYSLITFAK